MNYCKNLYLLYVWGGGYLDELVEVKEYYFDFNSSVHYN